MKIYKIWQTVNNNYGTYDSAIVVADNEEDARMMSPSDIGDIYYDFTRNIITAWACKFEQVHCEYIGEAKNGMKKGVVVASFNAG
jgi:hypothetical protein